MRIAHLSDLHVTEGLRLEDQARTLAGIVDDVIDTDPHLILIAGDFFGRTVPHRSTPAERAALYPQIVRLAGVAPVVVIYGNHDHDPDLDALACLGGEWPVRVVKTAAVLSIPTAAGTAHLYCIPYPTKRWLLAGEDAPKGLEAAQRAVEEKLGLLLSLWGGRIRSRRRSQPTEPHILLAHLQVAGSATSGGEVLAGQEIELSRAQLDGLPIDYGALGHLHMRQQPALRCWYPGSPWRNDYGETDAKGWHAVEVGDLTALDPDSICSAIPGERLAYKVTHMPSRCRRFVTLDYRWAADAEDGAPRWISRPTEAAIEACAGAEVRLRLVVPEQWIGGCPWPDEVARVRALAERVQEERKIEPVLRVRAPAVAAATTVREKIEAYWQTLATPLDASESAAALALLADLEQVDDATIAAETQAIAG